MNTNGDTGVALRVGDSNWAALQKVVEAHAAAGKPARLTPEVGSSSTHLTSLAT